VVVAAACERDEKYATPAQASAARPMKINARFLFMIFPLNF
jgi:hypothetical protein